MPENIIIHFLSPQQPSKGCVNSLPVVFFEPQRVSVVILESRQQTQAKFITATAHHLQMWLAQITERMIIYLIVPCNHLPLGVLHSPLLYRRPFQVVALSVIYTPALLSDQFGSLMYSN